MDKFRDHFLGVPFVIITDNNPVAHLQNAKLGTTEMRWVAQLEPSNFEVLRIGVLMPLVNIQSIQLSIMMILHKKSCIHLFLEFSMTV